MKFLFAGDFHGNWNDVLPALDHYLEANPDIEFVIQVGDFGFWPDLATQRWNPDVNILRGMDRINNLLERHDATLLFADGNHENHDELAKLSPGKFGNKVLSNIEHMPRGSIFHAYDGPTIAFFGGGTSLDRQYRTEGESWWANEAPNYSDLYRLGQNVDYIRNTLGRPIDIVVSHEVPIIAGPTYTDGHHSVSSGFPKLDCDIADALRRGIMMDAYRMTRPDFWYYGHHHQYRVEENVGQFNTQFVGLNRDTSAWNEMFWVHDFGAGEETKTN